MKIEMLLASSIGIAGEKQRTKLVWGHRSILKKVYVQLPVKLWHRKSMKALPKIWFLRGGVTKTVNPPEFSPIEWHSYKWQGGEKERQSRASVLQSKEIKLPPHRQLSWPNKSLLQKCEVKSLHLFPSLPAALAAARLLLRSFTLSLPFSQLIYLTVPDKAIHLSAIFLPG